MRTHEDLRVDGTGLDWCMSDVIGGMSTSCDPTNVPLPPDKCSAPCVANQFTAGSRPCDSQCAVQPRC